MRAPSVRTTRFEGSAPRWRDRLTALSRPLYFFGGNGHADIRVQEARSIGLREGWFDLINVPYPSARSFDDLLEQLGSSEWATRPEGGWIYATGIGALVALSLRSKGAIRDIPLVLQGGVLWGLERRWFPKIMRIGPMPRLLASAFRSSWIRAHFVDKHFRSTPSPEFVEQFFDGYDDADAFANWFEWLRPDLLRRLENAFRSDPSALDNIRVWWGEKDTVVGPEELRVTQSALGVDWPLETFPTWGHYPMIDDPLTWSREVGLVLASAEAVSR